MLYLIGGASRSGKSTIARRMLTEKQVSYFPVDAYISSIEDVETFGIKYGMDFEEKSEKLWPLLDSLCDHLYELEDSYLIEGDGLLPYRVHEFMQTRNQVHMRVCFVGYCTINPEEKLKLIRANSNHKDDWTRDQSDEKVLSSIESIITFSKYLREECEKYNIKFFDSSDDFLKTQDEIMAFLTK